MKSFSAILFAAALAISAGAGEIKLLNVSYDPTRQLYTEYNAAFGKYWKAKTQLRSTEKSWVRPILKMQHQAQSALILQIPSTTMPYTVPMLQKPHARKSPSSLNQKKS